MRAIRSSHLSGLSKLEAREQYLTDKLPLNFWWVGFIMAAIPEAKIIHVRRDARATCWSNFNHFFSRKGIDFANDLQDVAAYYEIYVDLMDFWHGKFSGKIFDLNYETLTENQEEETRSLVEHVGLEWEENCLQFHETERVIRTASAAQVRQKIYRGSSEDWRNYEKHLEPMTECLKGV